jgi:hypothetical protein
LCLNFVQGGGCYATGVKCLLGLAGSSSKNEEGDCELHGKFDVWVTQTDELLISDMGFPSSEPKQCLALGVNYAVASKISNEKSKQLGTRVHTTERRCFRCARRFWISDHRNSPGLQEIGQSYLCPICIREKADANVARKVGVLRYWCG